MRWNLLVGLLALAMMVGCEPLSQNKKLAYSDSACTLGTAAALDEAPKDVFPVAKTKTIEVATALLAFVETGNMADLSFNNTRFLLIQFLTKKGWGEYSGVVDTALTYVKTQNVDVDKIGGDNVALIRAGLEAVIRSAKRCTLEGQSP